MERVNALDTSRQDSMLILGMYQYAASTLAWPMRLLAALGGIPSDRTTGIRQLEAAASNNATRTDAELVLMIVYNREGRQAEALSVLHRLRNRHPGNRLLTLNAAVTALDCGASGDADRWLTEGLAQMSPPIDPLVIGEEALWRYKRGTARLMLGRTDEGLRDLLIALGAGPRGWVAGRIHLELGKLALRRPDLPTARTEFERARSDAERSGDRAGLTKVKILARDLDAGNYERPPHTSPHQIGELAQCR